MEIVVAERLFDTPPSPDGIRKSLADGRWCLELYGVDHLGIYMEPAGARAFCAYRSRDLESVRQINRRFDMPYRALWRGAFHPSEKSADPAWEVPRPAETLVVVERAFDEQAALEELGRRESDNAWCMDQHRVRYLHTYFAADGRRMLCVYAAPDAESVRIAQRTIGMPLERAWAAVRVRGEG